MYKAINQA